MAARGVTVVDCPISGGPAGCTRAGTLSVMVSGDPCRHRAHPADDLALGPHADRGRRQAGAAQVLKLTNNILSAVALAATAEAFVTGAKGGSIRKSCSPRSTPAAAANSATLDKFPAAVLTRGFDYGAEMHILMKDIDLAIAQGEELGVPMWVCQAARLVFKHAIFEGAADNDISTLIRHVERHAGFEISKTR